MKTIKIHSDKINYIEKVSYDVKPHANVKISDNELNRINEVESFNLDTNEITSSNVIKSGGTMEQKQIISKKDVLKSIGTNLINNRNVTREFDKRLYNRLKDDIGDLAKKDGGYRRAA